TLFAALMGAAMAAIAPMPLWLLLTLLSLFSFGLGTVFPVSTVSVQNAVARAQIGTATGAMNFFRALLASFTVAAFAAILMIALPDNVSLAGDHHVAGAIAAADLVAAFRYVFAASGLMLAGAALCLVVMEERRLAGPSLPAELAE
ncbi:MAG TPA: hypothetical protein VES39_08815, partial [Rhodospirillales bacterium]|nr:hypothetical protein [Rhodospirillales bacterium]